jgi:hypothetical protein
LLLKKYRLPAIRTGGNGSAWHDEHGERTAQTHAYLRGTDHRTEGDSAAAPALALDVDLDVDLIEPM